MDSREDALREVLQSFGHFKGRLLEEYKELKDSYGLTPPIVKTLLEVSAKPMSLREIADKYAVTPGAVTQFVDVLVAKSLVVRAEDPNDRRSTIISVPEEAKPSVREIEKAHHKVLERMFENLSDDELVLMRDLFNKLS